ncbi:MAG: signal transduction histidine kinase, nitrogen specific, NtrB, partial [Labilithrix sp.]|nr:signal transduction histidine kinase, nitrogen specific, NtrB [Labilithrix sp.]
MNLSADLEDVSRRARFEAVRRRVFSEMAGMTSRWRFAMFVPFHVLVIGILASRDFPRERLAVQIASSLTVLCAFGWMDKVKPTNKSRACLFLGGVAILVAIANTGGLASPLILSLVPFFMGVAMNPELENRRRHFLLKFVVIFGIMAWFSRKCTLPAPLGTSLPFATSEYVTIALTSALMSIVAVYQIG